MLVLLFIPFHWKAETLYLESTGSLVLGFGTGIQYLAFYPVFFHFQSVPPNSYLYTIAQYAPDDLPTTLTQFTHYFSKQTSMLHKMFEHFLNAGYQVLPARTEATVTKSPEVSSFLIISL